MEGPTANKKTKVRMSFRVISDIRITGKYCIVALHFLTPFHSTPTALQEVSVRDDPTGKTFFVEGFIQILNRDIYLCEMKYCRALFSEGQVNAS